MKATITAYFEQTVIPPITERFPRVAEEMIVQVIGSYALGIADDLSDLESNIWLSDETWKAYGRQLQLALKELPQFARKTDEPQICVRPLSWLGAQLEFAEGKEALPWEKVDFDQLHFLQESLILRDPQGIFRRIKEASAPERYPDWLWRKKLILGLRELDVDLKDLRMVVARRRDTEAHILFGKVFEDLLHLGFIIDRRYRPWRKHLRWAFDRLPVASRVLPHIEKASASCDWAEKVAAVEAIRTAYGEYIVEKGLLTRGVLEDLDWAEHEEAWSNPRWQDMKRESIRKAREAGFSAEDEWIWRRWEECWP